MITVTEQDVLDQNKCVKLSNGYEALIPLEWGEDKIEAEIENILLRFNSDNPPIHWHPYEGFND